MTEPDPSIWRERGAPLLRGSGRGPLVGWDVAVKDLFAVRGYAVGAGVPRFLAEAPVETATAPAVQALLDAGADVAGIAQTDEFAYSIAGANPHSGTPPNPRVPGGLPGGSSSGPASAVALGQAVIGLGTDTGGSIRVPASYQGLWGIRTTHGRVPREGLLPLAPSFDTVGWLARDPAVLAACAEVSVPDATRAPAPRRFVVAPELLQDLEDGVPAALQAWLDGAAAAGRLERPEPVALGDVAEAQEAFRVVQAFEAWRVHGPWLATRPDAVSGPVAERFRIAAAVTADDAERARQVLIRAREDFGAALDGAVLLLPSAASSAPRLDADAAAIDRARRQTLRLTCVAGVLGAPAVSAPLLDVAGAPLGLCLVGPRDSDEALIALASEWGGRTGPTRSRRTKRAPTSPAPCDGA